ncbi:predicted protein, partial [Nematostella vectensis]
PWKLRTALVDDVSQVMFCYIPKVASGNWKRVFIMLQKGISNPAFIDTQAAHNTKLRNLGSSSSEEIARVVKKYRQFVVVREPMERLLSAYINKIHKADYTGKFHRLLGRQGLPQGDHKIPYQEQVNDTEKISFSEFVDFIITQASAGERLEIHWERMHKICYPCFFEYDYIGKYETLQRDSRFILDRVPGAQGWSLPDVKADKGRTTKANERRYFSQLRVDQLRGLLEVYRLDYELFNYPLPIHL